MQAATADGSADEPDPVWHVQGRQCGPVLQAFGQPGVHVVHIKVAGVIEYLGEDG